MTLTFKKVRKGAVIPAKATRCSAGLDLHACIPEPVTVNPGDSYSFPTGVAVCPDDENVVMLIFVRSGHGIRHCLTLPNSVGVIDSDYRGEITVPIINHGHEPYTMQPGERFAQLVTVPVVFPETAEADVLPDSERGVSGFGSSGKL